jgi:hypothetical protein
VRTLYRVADDTDPFFGFGSYWSTSKAMVEEYRSVRTGSGFGSGRLYRLDVEIPSEKLADLREPLRFIDSDVASGIIDQAATDGFEWVVFYESPYRDRVHPQFIYCGPDNLEPVAVE